MHPTMRRAAALAFTTLAAGSLATGTALAKGGSGGGGGGSGSGSGGGGTTTVPTPPPPDCIDNPIVVAETTPDIILNRAGDAGCFGVRNADGTLRLAFVFLNPGWTYEVLSDGTGTNSRVELQFTNPTTGGRVDARVEFGKTDIRGS